MSVQDAKLEIARAKLVVAALILAVMAGACAPQLVHKTKIALTPAQVAMAAAANS
ncbi:MAG TPA: hypothetical protein VGO52_02175 [Hyphomonadaceae bacterium]|jgi:hypothetical protein|nr:hypothetical protein [Hyphomonadaceae bacterium]